MIVIDTRTGEVAVGSCTCLTGLDLQALTPVLLTGVGAAAAQSAGDSTQQNRTFIRDGLATGVSPPDIITGLSVFDDENHQSRQYGIANVLGQTATFTGSEDGAWAGGQTGSFNYTYAGQTGTIVYAVQGNVLTGEPVVQMAVDALHNTDGDLPARFMAAMQAARSMGGDGRCSCPGGVTTCGSPPPTFTKSAHIGYMLVARAGDKNGTTGVYRQPTTPSFLATGDLDGDGRLDIVSANMTGASVSRLLNASTPGGPCAVFRQLSDVPVPPGPLQVALGDLNGDGRGDIVTGYSTFLSVMLGLAGGGYAPHADSPLPGGVQSIVLADCDGMNGIDATVVTSDGSQSTLLNNGSGLLGAAITQAAEADPRSIVLVDLDHDQILDAVIAARGTNHILVRHGNGDGTFTALPSISTPTAPTFLVCADFNHDGNIDIACTNLSSPPSVTIYLNNGSGGFSLHQTVPITNSTLIPTQMAVADFNGDGNPDLIFSTTASRFMTMRGSATGSFALPVVYSVGFPIGPSIVVGDFNGDGRPDAAFPITSPMQIGVATNRGDGSFQSSPGTAAGDYFMTFNVPNQQAANPDPVVQLQGMFDTWRTNLTGRPDAVQSLVGLPALNNYSTHSGSMTIQLRDWRGQTITAPITSVSATLAPGGPGVVTVGAVTNTGPGGYSVALTTGNFAGTEHLIVTVDDGVRKVVLMPRPEIRVGRCPADFDGDGDNATDADIEAFFACLAGSCCATCLTADFDQDGDVGTDADIELFIRLLGAGCGP
jgi:hypothetical protein